MGFIDCDSHVSECDDTWDYLDPGDRGYRPKLYIGRDPEAPGVAPPSYWVAGDAWTRNFPADSNLYNNANSFLSGTTQLHDVAARIDDLDALGIDVQLLISTFWIGVELDHPLVELALCRSFNRWLAERLAGHTDRLPWVMRAPLRSPEQAVTEIEWCRQRGAVAIQFRGVEHGYFLADPMFWRVYEAALANDMFIAVHLGDATRRTPNIPFGKLIPSPPAAMSHVHKVMAGFHSLISSDLHLRFPGLRWAFLEAGASWVPAVIQQHARLIASGTRFLEVQHMGPDDLAERNIFLTIQGDEDIAYLATRIGASALCTGTDYGHNDLGSELGVHRSVIARDDLDRNVRLGIVDTNGRRLLGVSADFRPAPAPSGEMPHVRRSIDHGAALL